MIHALMKRGNLETDTHTQRIPREHEGRDQDDVSSGQGKPKIASKLAESREEPWNGFFLTAPRKNQPCELILDFSPPEP